MTNAARDAFPSPPERIVSARVKAGGAGRMSGGVARAGEVRSGAGAGAAERVRLDWRDRFVRRRRLVTAAGLAFVVDLAETVSLEDGDALVLDDGRLVAVEAAAEPLVAVRAPGGAPAGTLARLAWHIGNRHAPAEVRADHLLVQRDHVIEDMLRHLGADLRPVEAPFRPEGGAYGHGRTHGHHHGGADDDPFGQDVGPAQSNEPEHGPHRHGHPHE